MTDDDDDRPDRCDCCGELSDELELIPELFVTGLTNQLRTEERKARATAAARRKRAGSVKKARRRNR